VLQKLPLFLVAAAFALSATACSSLTRPDEIQIYAEPPAAPAIRQIPGLPQGAGAPGAPGAAPGGHAPGGGG
jgi:hypothetical protein